MQLFIGRSKNFQTLGCLSCQENNYRTFFYTAAASSSRARKTTLDNVKKGEISKTCIFMEIRE